MQLQRHSNQQILTFDPAQKIGGGGEGVIYALAQDRKLVAKVYHRPTSEHELKLTAMFQHPPSDPMRGQGHSSIAWPVDLLRTPGPNGPIVGFLMPRVSDMLRVIDLYVPKTRLEKLPLFDYKYLHHTARNVAAAVAALHHAGYVVGDINESNILVSNAALVTLVDTDSFQVRDPKSGRVFRCGVGKPEFTPPEIQHKNFRDIDRAEAHDLFGLAVLIFQLLMEGTHPFAGQYTGAGEPPSMEERICAGHFPYSAQTTAYKPPPIAPEFALLHPELQALFRNCFEEGHRDPRKRPSATAWMEGLDRAEKALRPCRKNTQHRYGRHLRSCPWCSRVQALGGRDYFPSEQAVNTGQHLKPPPPKQAPPPKQTPLAPVKPPPTPKAAHTAKKAWKPAWQLPKDLRKRGKAWVQAHPGLYIALCAIGGGLLLSGIRGGLMAVPKLNGWFVSFRGLSYGQELPILGACGIFGLLLTSAIWGGLRLTRRP